MINENNLKYFSRVVDFNWTRRDFIRTNLDRRQFIFAGKI